MPGAEVGLLRKRGGIEGRIERRSCSDLSYVRARDEQNIRSTLRRRSFHGHWKKPPSESRVRPPV